MAANDRLLWRSVPPSRKSRFNVPAGSLVKLPELLIFKGSISPGTRTAYVFVGLIGLIVASSCKAELGSAPTWQPGNSNYTKTFCKHANTPGMSFSVNETAFTTGAVAREYVAQAGTVFAVAWNGPQMAPLDVLLGPYFPNYRLALATALTGANAGVDSMRVEQSGLIIEIDNHGGAFAGRVYLPQALPAGVRDDSIR